MRLSPFSRFIVYEDSMIPAFRPNDRVLTFNWISANIGDVIVFKDEYKYLLKRVKEVRDGLIIANADNKGVSTKIFNIKPSQVVGRVLIKY